MTYGRALKPKFFMDNINWQFSRGRSRNSTIALNTGGTTVALAAGSDKYQPFDLNPHNTAAFATGTGTGTVSIKIDLGLNNLGTNFICVMNHNLQTSDGKIRIAHDTSAIAEGGGTVVANPVQTLNGGASGDYVDPSADGDTLVTFDKSNHRYWLVEFEDAGTWNENLTVGCIILGEQYTLPISPDMPTPRGTGFEGVSVRRSAGGKSFGSAQYIDAGSGVSTSTVYQPFRNSSGTYGRQMGGRESFDFNFSYIADTQVYPSDRATILPASEDSFIYNVFNKAAGELLPFIFIPDSTSTTEGDFLFARFDQASVDTSGPSFGVETFSARIVQEF